MEEENKPKAFSVLHGKHSQEVITPNEIYEFFDSDKCRDIIMYNTNVFNNNILNELQVLDFCPTNHEEKFDSLSSSWLDLLNSANIDNGKTTLIYLNPPYDNVDAFIIKANQELEKLKFSTPVVVVFLIPARIATIGFDQFIWRTKPQNQELGWTRNACFFIGSILGHLKFMGHKRSLYCDMCMVFMSNRNKFEYNETIRYNRMEPCYTVTERRKYGISPRLSVTERLKRKMKM